ncbi:MAG: hypothetical protein F7B61_02245 [Caldisphaeraceae archaeon]|nr:hypothetical protein [Caldisphaeraceae archaeon]
MLLLARRRRRKSIKPKRPRQPSRYFQCPRCSALTLTIEFKKIKGNGDKKLAIAKCGNCHLYCEMEVPNIYDRVDVYNKIIDLDYEGRLSECEKSEEFKEAKSQVETGVE